ncbi:MAG: PA14 domain-containing protein, partial [Chitinophagaceae bacterium]
IPSKKIVTNPNISYDWLPTFTEAAGLPAPECVDGVSLLPSLTGRGKQQQSLIYVEYFQTGKTPDYKEFSPSNRGRQRMQMQLIRFGDTVGLRYDIKSADDDFELYNAVRDTHQSINLGAGGKMKETQKMMKEKVLQVRRVRDSTHRPYDEEPVPATKVEKTLKGLTWKMYGGNYKWVPNVSSLKPSGNGITNDPGVAFTKNKTNAVYVFEGYINIPEEGDYTFYLTAGNKSFIRIHDAILIDADYGFQAGSTRESTIKLKAGLHPVKIYSTSAANNKNLLNFEWKGPSFQKSIVPAEVFFHK